MNKSSKTNWARVDALTEDEIDTSDSPPLPEDFFAKAHWRTPKPHLTASAPIDPDTLDGAQESLELAESDMSDYLSNLEDYEERLARGEVKW